MHFLPPQIQTLKKYVSAQIWIKTPASTFFQYNCIYNLFTTLVLEIDLVFLVLGKNLGKNRLKK